MYERCHLLGEEMRQSWITAWNRGQAEQQDEHGRLPFSTSFGGKAAGLAQAYMEPDYHLPKVAGSKQPLGYPHRASVGSGA